MGSQRVVHGIWFGVMFALSIKLLHALPLPGTIALVLVVLAIGYVFNRSTR